MEDARPETSETLSTLPAPSWFVWLKYAGWAIGFMLIGGIAALSFQNLRGHGDFPPETLVVLSGDKDECMLTRAHPASEAFLSDLVIDVAKDVVESATRASADSVLQALAARDANSVSSTTPTYLYRLGKLPNGKVALRRTLQCIVVARGHVGDIASLNVESPLFNLARQHRLDPQGAFAASGSRALPFGVLRALHFDDYPASYYEFGVEVDTTGRAAHLVPLVVYFRDSYSHYGLEKPRTVKISIAGTLPAQRGSIGQLANNDPALFRTDIEIDNLYPASVDGIFLQDGSNYDGFQSAWFNFESLPDARFESLVAAAAQMKGIADLQVGPFNLTVVYSESEEPSWIVSFLRGISNSGDQRP